MRSLELIWMSKLSPRQAMAMAVDWICQEGRTFPQGDGVNRPRLSVWLEAGFRADAVQEIQVLLRKRIVHGEAT